MTNETAAMSAPSAGSTLRYRTVLIDPPWPIKWAKSETLETAPLQYQTMPIAEIMQLPIDSIADDHCVLLMWVTNEFLPEGLGIVRHWKFQYDKLFTWCKNNGMGAHPRNATEHVIMAHRGQPPRVRGRNDKAIMNWASLPVQRRHSRKPPELYGVFEQFTPEPRIELFAREKRDGWHAWGNEVESDVSLRWGATA